MPTSADEGWLSRERAAALALLVITAVVFFLCYRLILPFLPALAWALALAVVAHPLHRAVSRAIPNANAAAAVSVVLVALVIVIPVIVVTHNLVRVAGDYANNLQQELESGRWRATLERYPLVKRLRPWVESGIREQNLQTAETDRPGDADSRAPSEQLPQPAAQREFAAVGRAASMFSQGINTLINSTLWFAMQMFITFLSLFFFFRDRQLALHALRSRLPLSNAETDEVFNRVDNTIHATIYGSLVVAVVQGTMGGLMFWWLGLPVPLLWGVVMGLLAVVPVLGTFVIWAPTALILALGGDWTSAFILAAWGGIAIALIDNCLYPYLVGKRLRFHTLLEFVAIVGGLAVFGASGIILGPLLLATGDALLNVWRQRTANGGTIERAAESAA